MEQFLKLLADVAGVAERSCGDPRGPVQIETAEESIAAAGCVGAGWLERKGGTVRLTASGLDFLGLWKQAGSPSFAGQPAPPSPLNPASAGLLGRMADVSRAHFGSVSGPLTLDGAEHIDAAPLVAAGLVERDGDSYRLTAAGAATAG